MSSISTTQEDAAITPTGTVLRGAKLDAPHLPPGSIRRPRLTSRLADPGTALAVVIGPAGYGKTALLADWAQADPRAVVFATKTIAL